MNVRSRASRILRQLSWYRGLTDESAQAMGGLEGLNRTEDEHYLGIYENIPGDTRDGVVVTDKGLHVDRGGAWEFISYANISLVEVLQPKTEATELTVRLLDGRVADVPIRGGRGRLRDVWEFVRFLLRVQKVGERGHRAMPLDTDQS